MKSAFFALLFAFGTTAIANCGSHTVMQTTREDGTTVGITISETQFSKAPVWTPEAGEPPLSIAQVVKVSSAWAKDNFKRFDSVQIRSINLSEIGCSPGKRSWYYIVHFAPVIDGSRVFSGGHFVAVLLDGSVVAPTTIKK